VYSPTIVRTGETQTVGEYTHPTLKDCGVIPAQALKSVQKAARRCFMKHECGKRSKNVSKALTDPSQCS
jgi:hypothetical protein